MPWYLCGGYRASCGSVVSGNWTQIIRFGAKYLFPAEKSSWSSFLSCNWSLLPTQIISIPIPLPLDCLLHNWLHFYSLLCWNKSLNVMWEKDWGVFWERDLVAPAIVQCLFFILRIHGHGNTLSFHEHVSHPVTIILPGTKHTYFQIFQSSIEQHVRC